MVSSASSQSANCAQAGSPLLLTRIATTNRVQFHSATQPQRKTPMALKFVKAATANKAKSKRVTDPDNFPELTNEQLAAMRPAREVMPPQFFEAVKRKQGQRGLGKKPAKVLVSLRIEPEVLAALKAHGPGWQRRVGKLLRQAVVARAAPAAETKRARSAANRNPVKALAKKLSRHD
jgi:uncharacterized protein (DUF4415 family)